MPKDKNRFLKKFNLTEDQVYRKALTLERKCYFCHRPFMLLDTLGFHECKFHIG